MSRTLTAMAILRANWDDDRDYLSNFEAFVTDALQRWPDGEPLEPDEVRKRILERWSLELPLGVVETLLRRARRNGLVTQEHDGSFVVPGAVNRLDDLEAKRAVAQSEMTALVEGLREQAAAHGLPWSDADAEAALLAYLDEYGLDFAAQRRRGELAPSVSADEAVAVVHSFALKAFEEESITLTYLEHALKGSMLANVLYFEDLGSVPTAFGRLVVYLDTPIVVRALGVALPQMVDAARDLLDLLRVARVPARVFTHSVQEIEGVLTSVAESLRKPHGTQTARRSRMVREVLDYFIAEGKRPADVLAVQASLSRRLRELGIQQQETPTREQRFAVDETALERHLTDNVRYTREVARRRDVDSLVAIHHLRKGRTFRCLADCPAVFVTPNAGVASASRAHFDRTGVEHPVPHCLHEPELVTQLWILKPGKAPDVPRRQVILDSFSLLNPPTVLWNRYVDGIEELEQQGTISEEEVSSLIHSMSARTVLAELTLGLDERFDDGATVQEVIATVQSSAHQDVDDDRLTSLERSIEALQSTLKTSLDRRRRNSQGVALAGAMGLVALPFLVDGIARLPALLLVAAGVLGAIAMTCLLILPEQRTWKAIASAVAAVVAVTAGILGIAWVGIQAREAAPDARPSRKSARESSSGLRKPSAQAR